MAGHGAKQVFAADVPAISVFGLANRRFTWMSGASPAIAKIVSLPKAVRHANFRPRLTYLCRVLVTAEWGHEGHR
jgi:hypothetical protein